MLKVKRINFSLFSKKKKVILFSKPLFRILYVIKLIKVLQSLEWRARGDNVYSIKAKRDE